MREINLSLPLQGRRWLKCLREDPVTGIRLQPGLDLPASAIGFSFRANALGLHGPDNTNAGKVIFGTSFAQGMAVNEGENWFQLGLDQKNWLNLGLPVGIAEWAALLRLHHRGPAELALLVWHPNIWQHCHMYERVKASGRGTFAELHWETAWGRCLWLTLRRSRRKRAALASGDCLLVRQQGKDYDIDLNYTFLDLSKHQALVDRNILRLKELLQPFRRVIVVRVPVKQDLIPADRVSEKGLRLQRYYHTVWDQTKSGLAALKQVEIHQPDIFRLEHYHPFDTHWNAAGNRVFADWLSATLSVKSADAY